MEVKPSDTACFQYTGGTTGVAKGAELTHANLMSNAVACRHWLHDIQEAKDITLTALPLYHSYAMTTCMHQSVYLAGAMLLIPDPRDLPLDSTPLSCPEHRNVRSGVRRDDRYPCQRHWWLRVLGYDPTESHAALAGASDRTGLRGTIASESRAPANGGIRLPPFCEWHNRRSPVPDCAAFGTRHDPGRQPMREVAQRRSSEDEPKIAGSDEKSSPSHDSFRHTSRGAFALRPYLL